MLGVCLVSNHDDRGENMLISIAGEDALANLSIEKEGDDGPVTGFVRIRSRSQGLALSLGSLKGLNKVGGFT